MGCGLAKPQSKTTAAGIFNLEKYQIDYSKYPYMSRNELTVLLLLFKSLTYYCKSGNILEKCGFLSFVKAPGLLGEKVYEMFDLGSKNFLEFTDFIKGMEKFCKSPEDEQKLVIYQLFLLESQEVITENDLNLVFHHFARRFFKNFRKTFPFANKELSSTLNSVPVQDAINEIKHSNTGKEFSQRVLSLYSANKVSLSFPDFCRFLSDFPQLLSAIHEFFNFSSWQDLDTENFSPCQISKDFYYGEINCEYRKTKLFAVLRSNILLFFSDSSQSAIIDLIYLPEAQIKTKDLTISIYKYSENKPKASFSLDNIDTLQLWKKYLDTQTGLTTFNDYELKEVIGSGIYSKVFRAINKVDGSVYAVKSIKKSSIDKQEKKLIFAEVSLLSIAKHRNIVKFKDFVQTENFFYIVEELVEGQSLQKLIKVLTENEIKSVIRGLLQTLEYLHGIGIIHRDIKMGNLFVTRVKGEVEIKIIDFDLADFKLPNKRFDRFCGTVAYMAPEFHLNESYDETVDIWSVGVIAFVLIAKRFPFNGLNEKEIIFRVLDLNPDYSRFSQLAKSFIELLLNKKGSLRPSAKQSLEHEWLKVESGNTLNKFIAETPKTLLKSQVT